MSTTEPGVQLLELPIKQIEPSPWNPRKYFQGISDLAQSIKEQGLLQPLIVRPVEDHYELVAGERRLRACRIAELPTALCLVQDLSDDQAREVIVTENLQREDLTPIEEAAGVAALLEAGHSPAEIAARIGRDARWVALRRRILSLHPVVRKSLEAGAVSTWTIGHYEALSTLAPEAQAEFWQTHVSDSFEGCGWAENWSIEQLTKEIGKWQRRIVTAPWKPGDATLPGGACTECEKRSSREPDLFAGEASDELLKPGQVAKEDQCLDLVCWQAKQKAFTERREQELRDQYGDQLVIIAPTRSRGERPTVPEFDLVKVKKSDPKGRPALVTHGPRAGEVQWVAPPADKTWKSLGLPDPNDPAAEKKGKRPLAERRAELHAKRRLKAVADLADWLGSFSFPEDDDVCRVQPVPRKQVILALAAVFGTDNRDVTSGGDYAKEQWQLVGDISSSRTELAYVKLWNSVVDVLECRLRAHRPDQYHSAVDAAASAWQEAEQIADIVVYDLAQSLRDACVDLPEPSSWAKEPGYTPDPMVPDTSSDDAMRKDLVEGTTKAAQSSPKPKVTKKRSKSQPARSK